MANTPLNKVHIFPTEASYNTNESQVNGTSDLAAIKASEITSYPAFAALFQNITKNAVVSDSMSGNTNGYIKFSNGFIIQWGTFTSSTILAGGQGEVVFPISFTTDCRSLSITLGRTDEVNAAVASGYMIPYWSGENKFTKSGFKTYYSNYIMYWIAIGI